MLGADQQLVEQMLFQMGSLLEREAVDLEPPPQHFLAGLHDRRLLRGKVDRRARARDVKMLIVRCCLKLTRDAVSRRHAAAGKA